MATEKTNRMAMNGITALAETDLNIIRKALELAIEDAMNIEHTFTNEWRSNPRRRELIALIETKQPIR